MSAERLPSATTVGGILRVHFSDSAPCRSVDVTCTLDLSDFGDAIGVEVLDWRRQLSGGSLHAPPSCGPVRWSYDQEIDALYIHLAAGHSRVQPSAVAKVSMDSSGRVVRLEVPIPPPA